MKLVKGENLTPKQLNQVKSAFIYRFDAIGKDKYYPNEQAWIKAHAFYFSKNGNLSLKHRHCVPVYMAN